VPSIRLAAADAGARATEYLQAPAISGSFWKLDYSSATRLLVGDTAPQG